MSDNIILIDNHKYFLESRKFLLQNDGFTVFPASNQDEAKDIARKYVISAAIIDVRLEDNDDERDESGLRLARELDPSIPKIMLTQYPAISGVREALRPSPEGPIAEDYISKNDDYDELLRAVRKALRRKVFISHGHDDVAKKDVTRFVEALNFRPVVLSDLSQPGHTVIELLEACSNVGYAIIVLSPDDVGGRQDTTQELQSRARQNVIFEMGYFVAKLGRQNVFVLHKGGVEMPSNYKGVRHIKMDFKGEWENQLKEGMI